MTVAASSARPANSEVANGNWPGAAYPLPVRVVSRRTVAVDVMELELAPMGDGALPKWSAGAHVDVRLGSGLVRQYSLCGTPGDTQRYRIAVLAEREGRGGSRYVHAEVTVGAVLDLMALRNTFALLPRQRAVLVAGGIGITPLLAMAHELARDGREWELHYGGRSSTAMAYVDELAQYGAHVQLYPQDQVGPLPLTQLVECSYNAVVYACGPGGMLRALTEACGSSGVELRLERFGATEPVSGDTEFTVVLARTGKTVRVPAGTSVLESLEQHGIDISSSCQSGVCGSCEIAVLSGSPDHRDAVLTPAERDAGTTMLPCVSRAHSSMLELDI
jgi:ferredoxin-NADP reductase